MTDHRDGLWEWLRLLFALMAILAWGTSVVLYLFAGRAVDLSVVLMASAIATALFGPSIWRRRE